jgi:hypothetical protein
MLRKTLTWRHNQLGHLTIKEFDGTFWLRKFYILPVSDILKWIVCALSSSLLPRARADSGAGQEIYLQGSASTGF